MKTASQRSIALAAVIVFGLIATGCTAPTPDIPEESPEPLSFDIGSAPDFGSNMVTCLSDLGWPVEEGSDGSFSTGTIPQEQYDQYTVDLENCTVELGYDTPPPSLSEPQLKELYSHVLWAWKCLDDNGYEQPTPMSEQSFIDDYHEHGSAWSPYSAFTSTLSEDDISKMLDACPRTY